MRPELKAMIQKKLNHMDKYKLSAKYRMKKEEVTKPVVKKEVANKVVKRMVDRINNSSGPVSLAQVIEEVEQEDDDEGPQGITDKGGVVNIRSMTSEGFMIGDNLVEWPSLKLWLRLNSLSRAQKAYKLYAIFQNELIKLVQDDEIVPEHIRMVLNNMVKEYKESGIKFDVKNIIEVPLNILYAILHPLHLRDLENSKIKERKPWIYQKMRREIKNTYSNILYRARTPQEINWMHKYLEAGMMEEFENYIVPIISEFLERKATKSKKVRMP